jgi:hypothetical protein
LNPPKASTCPFSGSWKRLGPVSAGGDVAGLSWFHVRVAPSNVHVSPR